MTAEQPKRAEGVTCPSEFDQGDIDYATSLVPDGAFVTEMMTIVGWMDDDGEFQWRCYRAAGTERLSSMLGLIDMAKHEMMMRNTHLRMLLDAEDDDDD